MQTRREGHQVPEAAGTAMSTSDCGDSFEFFSYVFPVKVRLGVPARRRERPDHHDPRYLRIKIRGTKTSVQEKETQPRRMLIIRYSNWLRWQGEKICFAKASFLDFISTFPGNAETKSPPNGGGVTLLQRVLDMFK